jgi:sulfur carrier protein ThiS
MSSLKLCAEFSIFPDNHVLGPAFTLAGFYFKQLGTPDMIANDTANERGLSIPDAGVEITLPIPVSQVEIRIGTFNRPLDIEAVDSSGAVISQETMPLLNHYEDRTVSAKGNEISIIRFVGGGHEGFLARICINILFGDC